MKRRCLGNPRTANQRHRPQGPSQVPSKVASLASRAHSATLLKVDGAMEDVLRKAPGPHPQELPWEAGEWPDPNGHLEQLEY